jgi:hypothetical protein
MDETITIEQLDDKGTPFRTFTRHPRTWALDSALVTIAHAFNADHTRVTIASTGEILTGRDLADFRH